MISIMNTILKYLCGGIQEVIGKKLLIVWKEARTGAMIDTWVTFQTFYLQGCIATELQEMKGG